MIMINIINIGLHALSSMSWRLGGWGIIPGNFLKF